MSRRLKKDPEFYSLTIPASEEKRMELEQSLLTEGCKQPLLEWNGFLVDGFKRYEICRKHKIEYSTQKLSFNSKEDAIVWICRTRLPDTKKSSPIFRYLYGTWYALVREDLKTQIMQGDSDKYRGGDGVIRVSKKMAEMTGYNYSVVEICRTYAKAMSQILKNDPKMFRAIIEENITFSVKEVTKLGKEHLEEYERKKIRGKLPEARQPRQESKNRQKEEAEEKPLSVRIKSMPAYDPDREISGFTFTISSWVSSVARMQETAGIAEASEDARSSLATSLQALKTQIENILEVLT